MRTVLHLNRPSRMDQVNPQKPGTLSALLETMRRAAKVLSRPLKLRPPRPKSLLLACQKQTNGA